TREQTAKAARSFAARVRARGLGIHRDGPKKGHHLPLSAPFAYLGYTFSVPNVSVRSSTIERLLHSLASKISDYQYNRDRTLQRKQYLNGESLREAFLD